MDKSRAQRFREQKLRLLALQQARTEMEPYRIRTGAAASVSASPVLAAFEEARLADIAALDAPVTVSADHAGALLCEMRAHWNARRIDQLLGDCRSSVLKGVAGPFGLGAVVAAADRDGGRVTTSRTAKDGVYARPEDEYRGGEYKGSAYRAARAGHVERNRAVGDGPVQDVYSGKTIKSDNADCDHIVSTSQYHQEGGFMQSRDERKAFGADTDNFALTSKSANRSKQDKDIEAWQQQVAADASGRSNKEHFGHDNRRVKPAAKRGRAAAEKHAPGAADQATYYGERAAVTGASEAGKVGLQQSVGLLLTEFLAASFDEISDAYKRGVRSGTGNSKFYAAVRVRLERVAAKVADQWRGAVAAFRDGALSGFLSNLVTMLINMLVTTGKRIVRVIREGFMAILGALKMALFPPEGMTRAQAADAALKLLAAATVVSLGVMAEDVCEKTVSLFFTTHMPLLAPFAPQVAAVLVAALTGIASALLVYAIDRLDIFGVRRQRTHELILQELEAAIGDSDSAIDGMFDAEMHRLEKMVTFG